MGGSNDGGFESNDRFDRDRVDRFCGANGRFVRVARLLEPSDGVENESLSREAFEDAVGVLRLSLCFNPADLRKACPVLNVNDEDAVDAALFVVVVVVVVAVVEPVNGSGSPSCCMPPSLV